MITLDSIKGLITGDKKELALSEEVLGPDLFRRVSRLLNTRDLRLCNCMLSESDESHVRLTAQMPSVFGFNNITTDFSLFERPSARTGTVRNCVFGIEMPAAATVYSYLGQYGGDHGSPGSTAVTTMLANYFRAIAFEGRMMVFSSIDYTQLENKDAFYPEVYRTHIPASQVKAGMNFLAKIAYQEAASVFADVFETDSTFQERMQTESRNQPVVVAPVEQGVSVIVDKNVGLELGLGPISLSLDIIRVSLPVVTIEESQSQIGFIGSLKIADRGLKITAEFCPYYDDFSVSFWDFPSLKGMMGLLGQKARDAYFPEPLSSLLSVKLSRVGMALNLTKKTVRGVSLSLRTDEAIPLIENIIRFAPELEIGIDYPLDERRRAIQGELRGIWQFGKTKFRTALYYPSFNFCAGMKEGETLDVGAVLTHILSGIDFAPRLTFTRMEVYGNFLSKSFSAEIALKDFKWEPIPGRQFGFQIKEMRMAYDNQLVSYAMDGSLDVAGFDVLLSAQYKKTLIRPSAGKAAVAAGGWKFEGGTDEGRKIKISEVLKWVAKQFGDTPQLPEAIEGFTVDKLKLSFESESQDFFFTCEGEVILPGQNSPIQGIVTIDIKHQDNSYTKRFGGSLKIDGMEFALAFESASEATGGRSRMFVAAYHDDNGHTIKIDDLAKKVFAPGEAPTTGLEISLKDALFAYQKKDGSAKYLFGLDIEGGLNLSELNLPNLPLIGQPFPAGETLKLALQVLAAGDRDKAFKVEDIKAVNRLKSKGLSLPEEKEVQGLRLAALLRVGQETKPLSLPIGLDSQGKGLKDESPVAPATTREEPGAYPSSADGTKWINIQKTFGPIHVERVGVGYQTGNIALLLDAALTAAGLTLSLDGLGAQFALKDLANKAFKPTFHLNGLGIDYRSGPVEIGGSFLEQKVTQTVGGKEVDYTSYAGLAVIRTQKLTLSAIGSYAQINGRDPSLFIYAVANYPLGGPAFFYVTGFAAGFGYNRALTLPSIDEIASFPLVAEAVKDGGPDSLPSSQKKQQETLTNKLQQLERYLPPSVGDIFIAVGIKFTSFKQIDSFALLVVKFGRRFEIDLLGLSTLTAPPPQAAKPGGKTVAPIAEAQLVLKASFIPDEGFLGVRAQLTPNSYILSKDCHLTGGFAFYTWFEPHPHAGDFVLTLGGYHPKFIVPDHYPQVPRLGLNWQVSPELHIKADAYFALTGSAIMAGGHLQATWESGDLRAWFVAGADFILAWKPFHYDLELYIGIGVSYTFKAFGNQTLSVDLGANLHLWGPEFSGTVTVHWSIISFTVNFGEGAPQHLEKLDWNTFKTSFLPKPEQICSIAVQQGLMRQMKERDQSERWIVNPTEMVLVINSAIPLNKLNAGRMKLADEDLEERAKHLAVAPMGIESGGLTSTCKISIKRERDDKEPGDAFQVRPIWKSMPAGLWGKPNLTEDKKYLKPPDLNGAQLVENLLAGFEIRPIKIDQQAHTCDINQDELQYTTKLVECDSVWQELKLPAKRGRPAWDEAAKTVIDAGTRKNRDDLVKALGLANAVIDFGEQVNQGVLLAA
jgi:uncharacterized protein DUF6603